MARWGAGASCGHSSWASLPVASEDALSTKITSHGKRPPDLWPARWPSVAGKRLALLWQHKITLRPSGAVISPDGCAWEFLSRIGFSPADIRPPINPAQLTP